jgi:hypothetical protein
MPDCSPEHRIRQSRTRHWAEPRDNTRYRDEAEERDGSACMRAPHVDAQMRSEGDVLGAGSVCTGTDGVRSCTARSYRCRSRGYGMNLSPQKEA